MNSYTNMLYQLPLNNLFIFVYLLLPFSPSVTFVSALTYHPYHGSSLSQGSSVVRPNRFPYREMSNPAYRMLADSGQETQSSCEEDQVDWGVPRCLSPMGTTAVV